MEWNGEKLKATVTRKRRKNGKRYNETGEEK